jgi:hypothetical protein
MKESKSLERFKKQAQDLNKMIEGKTEQEIEKLVSIIINKNVFHYFYPRG